MLNSANTAHIEIFTIAGKENIYLIRMLHILSAQAIYIVYANFVGRIGRIYHDIYIACLYVDAPTRPRAR